MDYISQYIEHHKYSITQQSYWMNLVKLKITESKYQDQLHFHTLIIPYQKKKGEREMGMLGYSSDIVCLLSTQEALGYILRILPFKNRGGESKFTFKITEKNKILRNK